MTDGSTVIHTPEHVEIRGMMNQCAKDFLTIGSIITGSTVHLPPLKGRKLEEFKKIMRSTDPNVIFEDIEGRRETPSITLPQNITREAFIKNLQASGLYKQ